MWEAICEAEANSTSPTKRCLELFVGSGGRSVLKGLLVKQRTLDVICTNIDDNSARFEPGTLNKLGLSDGSDEDVCFFNLGCRQ